MESRELILNCIIQFIKEHNYSPTVREICDMSGLKSTSTVYSHLQRLKNDGLINMTYGERRTISVKGYKYDKE